MKKPDYGFWQVVFAIIAIIFAVLAVIIGYDCFVETVGSHPQEPTPTPTSTLAKISIIYPADSGMVNMTEIMIGNATNIPEGQRLWIAIYPQTAYKYYPQKPVNIQNDGSWKLPVQFGGENSVGEKFDIIAVLADKNAQKEFNSYMEASAKAEFWKGMKVLPDGTTEITRFTVTRV